MVSYIPNEHEDDRIMTRRNDKKANATKSYKDRKLWRAMIPTTRRDIAYKRI